MPMMPLRRLPLTAGLAAVLLCRAAAAQAPAGAAQADDVSARVDSALHFRYFQRALLPGPGGAIVDTESLAPLYLYSAARVDDIDVPWKKDSVDAELSAWGNLELGDAPAGRRGDADITVASVRHRFGPAYVTLGRQVRAGGAARFSRFDGAAAGLRTRWGLVADAYGGLTVLPRWSQAPGYHLLGSTADSMVRSPDAVPDPSRSGYWLAGGRLGYAQGSLFEVGATFHEEREGSELGRRNLGADLRVTPVDEVSGTVQTLLDADAWTMADLRAAIDVIPLDRLSFTAEGVHTEPSAFLSRQSVLSVFTTDAYDELGGSASYRPIRTLTVGGAAYLDSFGGGRRGARLQARVRVSPDRRDRFVAQLVYGRVVETENGYHSIRASVGYRPIEPTLLTLEAYGYYYDAAILEVRTSTVLAGNAEWTFARGWSVLAGTTMTRSPYAALDVQALGRLQWRFEHFEGGHR